MDCPTCGQPVPSPHPVVHVSPGTVLHTVFVGATPHPLPEPVTFHEAGLVEFGIDGATPFARRLTVG